MKSEKSLQQKAIETIRFLSADGVQAANSGHPGLPMGTAAMAYTIWKKHLKINPAHPKWADRDRFVLSGGHGSMLIYSLLHLSGFDLTLEELKDFRQWGSKTPGHPEFGHTVGVETTTGPLGQGFANGVGMAIAEAKLAADFNKPDFPIVDHYVYAIVTDGDLMEGLSAEAASLAGHLKLGKLIYLYDDNQISIEGSTDLAFTEDRGARFKAYGWHVQTVADGNDVDAIDAAIISAKADDRPSLIICKTTIGFGLPTKAGTEDAHGSPPGEDELAKAKELAGWDPNKKFVIPNDVADHFLEIKKTGEKREKDWKILFDAYQQQFASEAADFSRRMGGELPAGWKNDLPIFGPDAKGNATRNSSGTVLNAISKTVPELIGGSADLAPSNKTWIDDSDAFQADSHEGRNIHFGVRENAMGSIVNGIAFHGGFVPYGATFLVFSDYMRPAVRISALSKLHTIWVYTHDSIGVGEDGPTHQPVEHLAALRAIPNLSVIRPADANETREAWISAMENDSTPTALALSRQKLPTIDRTEFAGADLLHKGAYVLADVGESTPRVILMASGSEVQLILQAAKSLANEGIASRVVSFPSWDLFEKQPDRYQREVFPPEIKARLAVEAAVSFGWKKWVGDCGDVLAVDQYGASAPASKIFSEYGFTVENVVNRVKNLLEKGN
jgi:transketolase